MKGGPLLVVALGLAIAGCATAPKAGWSYKANGGAGPADGPLALWGEPLTMAFHVLRCNAAERTIEFEDIEVEEFAGSRPIRFEAGGQRWSGEERMAPPDGVPVSVAKLPLDHPVVTAIGGGAPLRITGAFGTMELGGSRAIRRVVAECRNRAAGA